MKIILNGGLIVNNEEIFFDNMSIELDGDIELDLYEEGDFGLDNALLKDFDDLESTLEKNGYDFNYTDESEEEYFEVDLDEMITDYTNALLEGDLCPDCIRSVLESMAIELLFDEDMDDIQEY